jgi:hypothetical protein
MKALSIVFLLLFFPTNENSKNKSDVFTDANLKVRSCSDVDVLASALKDKILNSSSKFSTPVTCYYVSNSGSDSNDGKTPGKAWATLAKVSEANLSGGDAVLFERNGLWRGSLTAKEGVSYSAYGKGEKPKIFGSLQNYSVKGKWLKTETNNVYVYDQALENDAGLLVFNNGVAHSYKKVIGIDGFSGAISELKNDLEMYHNINDKRVFLYSDKGNPADRYSSVEFCLKDHIIKIKGDNVLIDNLCIKYGGAHGIGSGSRNGLRVTNCEMGWIGGSIQQKTTRYGNAIEIYGGCKDYYVDHCYIYQVYDAGITHQYKNPTATKTIIMENVTYTNNLIEYCIYSIEYFLDQTNSEMDMMKNILIKDNICRFAGYGWGWQRPNKRSMHIQGWKHKNPAENFVITGNIFDRSKNDIIFVAASKEAHLPEFLDNIYIQNNGGSFGMFNGNYDQHYPFDQNIENLLKQKGIDKNPTIIFCDR